MCLAVLALTTLALDNWAINLWNDVLQIKIIKIQWQPSIPPEAPTSQGTSRNLAPILTTKSPAFKMKQSGKPYSSGPPLRMALIVWSFMVNQTLLSWGTWEIFYSACKQNLLREAQRSPSQAKREMTLTRDSSYWKTKSTGCSKEKSSILPGIRLVEPESWTTLVCSMKKKPKLLNLKKRSTIWSKD